MKTLKQASIAASMVLFCSVLTPFESQSKTYAGCSQLVEKIEKVQQKMRLGYTVAQGEKLKARLRYLKEQRNKCERHAEKVQVYQQKPPANSQDNHKGRQDFSHYQISNTWNYSQASSDRKTHWKKQQTIENKRIKSLNDKYAHAIKDANTYQDDKENNK